MRGYNKESMDGVADDYAMGAMGDLFSDLWNNTIRPALSQGAERAAGEALSSVGQTIASNPMVQQTTAQKALESAGQTFASQAKAAADLAAKYKYYLMAGGAVIAVGVLILLLKKKK